MKYLNKSFTVQVSNNNVSQEKWDKIFKKENKEKKEEKK